MNHHHNNKRQQHHQLEKEEQEETPSNDHNNNNNNNNINNNKDDNVDYTYETEKANILSKILIIMKKGGWSLEHVPRNFQADKDVVLAACQQDGLSLQYASDELQSDKEIALAACRQVGWALKYVSKDLQDDKDVVLAACQQLGTALRHASDNLKDDKDVVLAACAEVGWALDCASEALRADKDIVLTACRKQQGWVFDYASDSLKADKDVVLEVCRRDGLALEYVSEDLRADQEVVMTAVTSNPDALKFATGGLIQKKECLVAAKVWDDTYQNKTTTRTKQNSGPKIVLSTRFSLKPSSKSQATTFPVLLKQNEYIQTHRFSIYSPNAFEKDTCDPEWTRHDWPCRGTFDTCQKSDDSLKMGIPHDKSCWRYSFRYQLEQAHDSKGFMIQLVERDEASPDSSSSRSSSFWNQSLGKGQRIEAEMAQDIGMKVFRVHAPGMYCDEPFIDKHIELVTSKIHEWYKHGCTDMSKCVMAFGMGFHLPTPYLLTTAKMQERGLLDL